jgi:hypothetical protein
LGLVLAAALIGMTAITIVKAVLESLVGLHISTPQADAR